MRFLILTKSGITQKSVCFSTSKTLLLGVHSRFGAKGEKMKPIYQLEGAQHEKDAAGNTGETRSATKANHRGIEMILDQKGQTYLNADHSLGISDLRRD